MATIKEWLNEAGFHWEQGTIIYQPVNEEGTPEYDMIDPGNGTPINARIIEHDDPILIKEFDSGYGGADCPRFIAEDEQALYFPSKYDGATAIEKVLKDIRQYLNYESNPTPYPGGGG